jgi:hypothetical protein
MGSEGQREMGKAVRLGLLDEVKRCHARSPKLYLNADSLDCSLICMACSEGHVDVLEFLLNLGGKDVFMYMYMYTCICMYIYRDGFVFIDIYICMYIYIYCIYA